MVFGSLICFCDRFLKSVRVDLSKKSIVSKARYGMWRRAHRYVLKRHRVAEDKQSVPTQRIPMRLALAQPSLIVSK
jgi:hypothetical protein